MNLVAGKKLYRDLLMYSIAWGLLYRVFWLLLCSGMIILSRFSGVFYSLGFILSRFTDIFYSLLGVACGLLATEASNWEERASRGGSRWGSLYRDLPVYSIAWARFY